MLKSSRLPPADNPVAAVYDRPKRYRVVNEPASPTDRGSLVRIFAWQLQLIRTTVTDRRYSRHVGGRWVAAVRFMNMRPMTRPMTSAHPPVM